MDGRAMQLLEAFKSLNTSDDSKMVSILGSSGMGKSTLAQQLQGQVSQSGGFFIDGKFDIQQSVKPYGVCQSIYRAVWYNPC